MVDAGGFDIRGSEDLARVGKHLKEAGRGDLRRQMLAAIRKSAQAVVPDIQSSARSTLPSSGGLAAAVAAQKFPVRTSLAGAGGSVRLIGQGMKELRDINSGRLRHPVFGDRNTWSAQSVTPGFFTNPIEKKAPAIRDAIRAALDDVAREIARGI